MTADEPTDRAKPGDGPPSSKEAQDVMRRGPRSDTEAKAYEEMSGEELADAARERGIETGDLDRDGLIARLEGDRAPP